LAWRSCRNENRIQKDDNGASANNQLSWITVSRRFNHGKPNKADKSAPEKIIIRGNNMTESTIAFNRGKVDSALKKVGPVDQVKDQRLCR